MKKIILAALAAVLVLAMAAPAWACVAPAPIDMNRCRLPAHGGGPGESVVTVTASSTDYLGARLVVVRQRNVRLPFSGKGTQTVLSAVVTAEQSFTFLVPRRFGERGATYFAWVQDIGLGFEGCDTGSVAVSNEF